jgi:hypothetical protein
MIALVSWVATSAGGFEVAGGVVVVVGGGFVVVVVVGAGVVVVVFGAVEVAFVEDDDAPAVLDGCGWLRA